MAHSTHGHPELRESEEHERREHGDVATGVVAGAIAGGLVGGWPGAIVGGAAGAVLGDLASETPDPPETVEQLEPPGPTLDD